VTDPALFQNARFLPGPTPRLLPQIRLRKLQPSNFSVQSVDHPFQDDAECLEVAPRLND
jgi:hypothetical protein